METLVGAEAIVMNIVTVGGMAYWTVETRSEDTVRVKVRVLEARSNFGRTDFRVEPLMGSGEAWVQESTLEGA